MRTPSNQEIANILRGIGEYLAMQNIRFKPQAYERAALAVENTEEELSDIYATGGIKALKSIPSVGQSIAEHIEELLKTGKLAYYESLKKEVPVDIAGLSAIEGLGPKSIEKLYQALNIRTTKDLEKALKKGKIRELKGFGAKFEEKLLKGLKFSKDSGKRHLLNAAASRVALIEKRLSAVPEVKKITPAGSWRRRKESVGDLDFLVVSEKPEKVMDAFVKVPGVVQVIAKGKTKSSIKLAGGLNVDLRVVEEKSYGAALNYFTGSKEHNVALRQLAIDKGLKLNEYGLYRGEKRIAGKDESEIYGALGLAYIEPELRENTGEIEAAKNGGKDLPKLIKYGELKGDLQVQTEWTDGSASIEEMAKAAMDLGLEYIAITDHTKRLAMTNGLNEKRILEQIKEIDRINKKLRGKLRILKGSECDILKNGELDLPDEILALLDVVGVSVHSYFDLSREEQTERVVRAMRNPNADIFFHPTGRLIGRRGPIDLDMDEVIAVAKETGTVLEANAYPDRLDLKDDHIRKAMNAGVKIAIDSDAHSPSHFNLLDYGVSQARRGWATKGDVINAWPVEKMLSMLKKGKK